MIIADPARYARLCIVVAPEARNLAARGSRVRSKESETETMTLPAADTNPRLDCSATGAKAAVRATSPTAPRQLSPLLRAKFAARSDQSDRGPVSNVLHELAIGGTTGPAAGRSWPL